VATVDVMRQALDALKRFRLTDLEVSRYSEFGHGVCAAVEQYLGSTKK